MILKNAMKEVVKIFLDYLHNHKWQGRIFVSCVGISMIVAVSKLSAAFQVCKILG